MERSTATVRTRDGVALAATVWQPDDGGARPAVVFRTPYGRERFGNAPWSRVAEAGYAVVAVDVRGRGDSEGGWRPWVSDGYDGYDVIEWVAAQPWCDGNVGTLGGSYDAVTQWWAAVTQPPHLRCMIPISVSPQLETPGPYGRSNGVVMPYWLWWLKYLGVLAPEQTAVDWAAVMAADPWDMATVAGVDEEPWKAYLAGEIGYGEAGWAIDPSQVEVPALVTNGLWDDPKTFEWWTLLQQSPAGHRLLVGAWDHAGNAAPRPVLGGVDVSHVAIDPVEHWLAFLDHHLRGGPAPDGPAVSICRTGTWRWETFDEWPPPSQTRAHELGVGTWKHDPADPLWLGGASDLAFADAPLDPAALDGRDDVLVLDLPAVDTAVRTSGEPVVELTVTQPVAGTVVAWLSDVDSSGQAIRLGLWPTPAHHPGGTATLRIPLAAVHHELQPGHHWRVALAASFAPLYAHAPEPQQVTVESATLLLGVED
jgi:predicted acyl esterase